MQRQGLKQKIMKIKEEILKEVIKRTLNIIEGSPLHDAVMKAMEEYAQQQVKNCSISEVREQIIDYIENEAEIAMPIDELTHESGRSLTKKEYGHVLLKYLVKELREYFS